MQRKAVRLALPGIAMTTALVAGCTGGGGNGGGGGDAKGRISAPAPAPPGKYRSLPMPCKAVDGKRLKAMLPVDTALPSEQKDKLYAGVADTSYDGDRRVGCRWKAQDTDTTRLLYVGFERVVSYDRAADSDDDKAHQVYERQLVGAGLPAAVTATSTPTPTPTPTPSGSPAGGPAPAGSPGASPSGSPAPGGSPSITGGGSGSPGGTQQPPSAPGSRRLDGLGSEAFLDDRLSAAGATAQSRTVRIVFRTSNVIVTVDYSVQPSVPGTVPSAEETQDRAVELAEALAERFSD
ncbi:DUF3558 domain-containing protein [Streptomyces sp. NPDC051211]|uniref:DUF3558 domain-containing protein n=1 Tax=Streptomyces sp. NPDC051211 TaxID=3154643 RepID=UPI00344DBCDC